jgi:hypothetical protein
MAAASTDLLKKLSRKWVGQIGSAGVSDDTVTTIPLSSTTNLATDTAVVATIDRVDSNGTKTPTLEESVIGVVSGSNLVTCTRGAEGTAQAHAAGAVVEILVTAKGYNDIIDHLLVEHSQDGTHTDVTATTVTTTGLVDAATLKVATSTVEADDILDEDNMASNSATAIATQQSIKAYVDTYGNTNSLYRQALINGNMEVAQRGTSIAAASGAKVYTLDRWFMFRAIGATGATVSQQAITDLTGSSFCARIQRDNGNSGTGAIYFGQQIETRDTIKYRGQKITISFYARKGANFSATSDILVSKLLTGTGTDENAYTGLTDEAVNVTQNNTVTTSWQKFTMTTSAVIGATIGELMPQFGFSPTGTAGAADYFEVTQVQLCAGSVALPFMPKSYEDELRACRRYFQGYCIGVSGASVGIAHGISATRIDMPLVFPVAMRVKPTATIANMQVNTSSGAIAITAVTAITGDGHSVYIEFAVASGGTADLVYKVTSNGTSAYLYLSAEL